MALFCPFLAAGDRIRPILWSPEIKRPKTEPSLSSKNNNDLTLPALVGEPEKFRVRDERGIHLHYLFMICGPVQNTAVERRACARGSILSPTRQFSCKISKKTSQTTAVSQNNLEIVEMFIESCKREQKKRYRELKNF